MRNLYSIIISFIFFIPFISFSQTTITFDDQGWVDEEFIGTSVTLSDYTFSATENGSAIQLKVDTGNSFSGLALVCNNVNFVDGDILTVTKSSGSFDFQSFHYSGADFITSITVTGYKSSSQVATQSNSSPGVSGTFTLSVDFNDVDEIRITAGGGFGFLANLDQFVFDTAILGITDYLNKALQFYPNPVTNTLYLNKPSHINVLNITIYNSLGSVIKRTESSKTDLSNLPTGLYFAEIKTNIGTIIKKIIKK